MRDISNVKQEIINFRKVIRPQRPVLRDLEKVKQRYLAPDMDLEIYFDDIVDAHERIWDMLEGYKEVVEGLEETERVGDLAPAQRHPAGAHIDQRHRPAADPARQHLGDEREGPGEQNLTAFWVIAGVMVVLLVGMVAFFRKRGWLLATYDSGGGHINESGRRGASST